LQELVRAAHERGCTEIKGTYIPSSKNQPAADALAALGFHQDGEEDGATLWTYDLADQLPVVNDYIKVEAREEAVRAGTQ
jgi:predicted enzyme involved in methoxymalonyl-ACP biosynthesis